MILAGGRVARSAAEAEAVDLTIAHGRVQAVPMRSSRQSRVDIAGYIALPGLVNAHDHLEFNLYPRLGNGPYPSCKDWSADIYFPDRSPIREHLQVPKAVRLLWGVLKNLLSGVTTVSHHNRLQSPVFDRHLPIRIAKRVGWAHSLDFTMDVAARFRATPRNWPFIIHLAEAIPERGRHEIFELDRMGALDRRTVLVHAVGLDDEGLELARARGASIVWCPTSNVFMLGRTLSPAVFKSGVPIALGSDSALTAEGDLLDELRGARELSGLSAEALYEMVTEAPCRILNLPARAAIRGGTSADLILLPDHGQGPGASLLGNGRPDLVMVGGRIRLVAASLAARFPAQLTRGLYRFCFEGREMLAALDVPGLIRDTEVFLGRDFRLAAKRVSA